MLQDLRFAVRSLAASRSLTAAAVLTLALGIGATTAVYAVVDALLLRPLPFGPGSSRLVTLHSTHPTQAQDWDDSELSYADLLDLRDESRTLEVVEGAIGRNVSLTAADNAERVRAASITPGLFDIVDARPQIGRMFRPDEGAEPGHESVAIISDALWHRLYGGDPAIEQHSILVNGRALTVIGVMPPRFDFPGRDDVWLPYRAARDARRAERNMFTIGLRRPGATLESVRAEVGAIARRLADRYPNTNREWGIHAMPVRDFFVSATSRKAVTAMLAAVALVLIVGCANVAGLLVARGVGRQRELMVRAALGAGRARLVRLLLAEGFVLAAGGGALGVLFSAWAPDALVASNPDPPPYWAAFQIDHRVLLFTLGLTALASLLCGLIPALRISRGDICSGTMQAERTSGVSRLDRRLQGALVVCQVAVSFALLIGATLLTSSIIRLQTVPIGFDEAPLLSLSTYLAGDAYNDGARRAVALERVVDRVRGLPGVASAAATGAIPADDGGDGIRLLPERGEAGREVGAQLVPISDTFFETVGLRLIDGRTFTRQELEQERSESVIVNERLARTFWPGEKVVGRVLRLSTDGGIVPLRIVGVAPDIVYEELGEETAQSRLTVYVPYARAGWRSMSLLVRAANGAPASLAPSVRRALHDVDPGFAAFDLMTMKERRKATSWGERLIGRMFAEFAITAVLLACVGAFGLTAYSAARRTREIGVRIAMGATRRDIVALLLGRDGRLALFGIAAGLPAAIVAARLLQSLLFEMSPWNPAVWVATPVALLAAVLTASFLPARRASVADPASALRSE
jgi:predicted permease